MNELIFLIVVFNLIVSGAILVLCLIARPYIKEITVTLYALVKEITDAPKETD